MLEVRGWSGLACFSTILGSQWEPGRWWRSCRLRWSETRSTGPGQGLLLLSCQGSAHHNWHGGLGLGLGHVLGGGNVSEDCSQSSVDDNHSHSQAQPAPSPLKHRRAELGSDRHYESFYKKVSENIKYFYNDMLYILWFVLPWCAALNCVNKILNNGCI